MYNYIVAACHVQVNEVMILRHNHITFFYLCATNHMGRQFLIRKSDDVDNLVVRLLFEQRSGKYGNNLSLGLLGLNA